MVSLWDCKKTPPPQAVDRHYLVQVNSELAGLTGIASDDTDTTHSRWHQSIETQSTEVAHPIAPLKFTPGIWVL